MRDYQLDGLDWLVVSLLVLFLCVSTLLFDLKAYFVVLR